MTSVAEAPLERVASDRRREPPPHRGVIVAVFVVSRVLYAAAGVRFDARPVTSFIELLQPRLLQHDLLRSLWYLHAQPPGYNAVIGVLLHLPFDYHAVFAVVFLALGLVLGLTLYALILELAVPTAVALASASLFIVLPTTVLYENWLSYTYVGLLMLCVAALQFARAVRTNSVRHAAGFATAVAALAMVRTTFHLLFVLAVVALLPLASPLARRRKVVVALAIPVAVVAGLYVKNWIQFGEPTTSSWYGMNLAHMVFRFPTPELRADVAAGRLSKQALVVTFNGLDAYDVPLPRTGVPALDLVEENGRPNYNNLAYIEISRRYRDDALHYIRMHPRLYVDRVTWAFRDSAASAADYQAVHDNRAHIALLTSIESRLTGQVHDLRATPSAAVPRWDQVGWLTIVEYLAVCGAGLAATVQLVRRRRVGTGVVPATIAMAAIAVISAILTANLVELGDNNRFRFETDALVWAVATALGVGTWRWLRARRDRENLTTS